MKFRLKLRSGNLYSRFIIRVLAPPFLILLILSLVALQQLDSILHRQAIEDLSRSADTTATVLEREFSLRETVLKQTGAELFVIKTEYNANRKKLDSDRDACRGYIKQKATHIGAPGGVCEPFLSGIAGSSANLAALEDEYVKLGEAIIKDQNQRTAERLSAFKQFFPETLALLIIDSNKQVVSSAYSGAFKASNKIFQTDAEAALAKPIRGKVSESSGFTLATFAFQIPGGSVLAAYDVHNEQFIRPVWASAPIDRSQAAVFLLDSMGNPVYPAVKNGGSFQKNAADLRRKPYIETSLDTVAHTVVGSPVGYSNWLAVVASPTAAVLAQSRDTQLAGMVLIGSFIIGFLWVGTFFIRRTIRNIVSLVSGATVFGSGKLDYKIKLDHHPDGEFLRLADTMNSMAGRISSAEHAMDEKNKEFISIATHELRSPLTAIIANLTLFRDIHEQKLDDKAKHTVDQAYFSTVRLRDLVNDMLDVAHLESGHSEPKISAVPMKPLINDMLASMATVAKNAKVSLRYDDTHAASVLADPQRLRIILSNLVSNAIKYNRPNGHVAISHHLKNDQLVTVIEDNGLGIPEDQKARMFEKFFRVQHDDRRGIVGTGLGMYIVKQYVEQMHGKIWFESVHGKSTIFYFSLPRE